MKTVYLAGPIVGCTGGEASQWRNRFGRELIGIGVAGISPLRFEPPLTEERYGLSTNDPKFGTAKAISSKNLMDVRNCDIGLFYVPREFSERRAPYGTVCELAWSHMLGKPTILVTDDPALSEHPLIMLSAGWIVDNLDDALQIITGLTRGYPK